LIALLAVTWTAGYARAQQSAPPSGAVRWVDLPNTDTVFPPPAFDTLDAWKTRQAQLIEQVRFAAGLWPEPQTIPLDARIFGKLDRGDYTIEKVYFQSRPGLLVTGNLYRPAKVLGKVPAIACPHGHWPRGRLAHEERGSVPARCITLARLGAVVFAYDMVGFNDSKHQLEHKDPRLLKPENTLWGIGPLELQTFNSLRVLDFLQSLPEVDPARIGVTGASGGGTQTFILCALDERVTAAAPVNMISSIMQGGCACENAPALRIDTNNMEIAALFAPRPLLMVSATGDWTKNTPTTEYPAVRRIYGLYDAADRVANVHIDAPHNYNLPSRQAVYRFFAHHLLNRDDADTITEQDIRIESDQDLLVFADGKTPDCLWPFDKVIDRIRADASEQIESLQPTSPQQLDRLVRVVTVGLRHAIASDFPAPTDVQAFEQTADQGPRTVYARRERPVPTLTLGGSDRAGRVLWIDPTGAVRSDDHRRVAKLLADNNLQAIFTEPFTTGTNQPPADAKPPRGSTKFFTTFNRTDTAETVFDLLTALAALAGDTSEGIRKPLALVAAGRLGPPALAARAMVPADWVRAHRLRTVIDMAGFDGESDAAYLENLNLPNIRKIGGLKTLLAAAADGPIWLHNLGPNFPAQWAAQAGKLNHVEVRITPERASDAAVAEWLKP
jgi:dienelactone hydrolase